RGRIGPKYQRCIYKFRRAARQLRAELRFRYNTGALLALPARQWMSNPAGRETPPQRRLIGQTDSSLLAVLDRTSSPEGESARGFRATALALSGHYCSLIALRVGILVLGRC